MRSRKIKKDITRLSAENEARLGRIKQQLTLVKEKVIPAKTRKKPGTRYYVYQTAKYALIGAAGVLLIRKSPKLVMGTLGMVIPPVTKWAVSTVVNKVLNK